MLTYFFFLRNEHWSFGIADRSNGTVYQNHTCPRGKKKTFRIMFKSVGSYSFIRAIKGPLYLGSVHGALIVAFVGFTAAAVLASQQAAAVAASVINPYAPK